MNFEQWLQANGFDAATVSASQRILLEGVWRQSQNPAPAHTPPAPAAPTLAPAPGDSSYEAVVSKAEAETARRKQITELASTYLTQNPEMVAQLKPIIDLAIQGGWTKDQLELHLYRASMPAGPHVHVPSTPRVSEDVMEAAMCRAAGMASENVEKHFKDETLTAADKVYRSGLGLQRCLSEAARQNGVRGQVGFDRQSIRSTLRAAFHQSEDAGYSLNAGPSTVSVSNLLSNVGSKFSRDAFNAVEQHWKKISATRPVTDFKEVTTITLTADLSYKEIGAGGKIEHGKLGEEVYTNKADLYAILLGLDYKQIRNDDLHAFAQINKKMGRGGAQTINDRFWKKFLATAFWSTANGNYRANTDVAFGLTGLKKAHELVSKQVDPHGKPLGSVAKYLVVPRALELAADEAMTSTLLGRDDEGGTRNVLAGKWEVVSPFELDNASYTGYSETTYYLVRDPADIPVIEVAFLDGQVEPVIEEADADFNQLGIQIRAYHAFGVEMQEPVGGHKFKATAD